LAKLACGLAKPDGLSVIRPEEADAVLRDLPVERFYGVGPRTAEKLRRLGWRTGADLRAAGRERLVAELGKHGAFLHDIATGVDDRPVVPDQPRKSLGSETTFDADVTAEDQLDEVLSELCQDVQRSLERRGLAARRGAVTVKRRVDDFSTARRSPSVVGPFWQEEALLAIARRLAFEADGPRRPVRLLGVSVAELSERDGLAVQPRLEFE